jgi:hypothetical protein
MYIFKQTKFLQKFYYMSFGTEYKSFLNLVMRCTYHYLDVNFLTETVLT